MKKQANIMREVEIDGETHYVWRIGGLNHGNVGRSLVVKKTKEGRPIARLKMPRSFNGRTGPW